MNMSRVVVLTLGLMSVGVSDADDFKVDPKGSFLRAGGESPPPAMIVSLADLAVSPGEFVHLESLGDWDCGGPCGDEATHMMFVFSETDELLGVNEPHRVPGAIDVCPDFVSSPTFNGGLPTDIPEDFRIGGPDPTVLVIRVPEGAAYIFVAVHDSLYNDNIDPDNDFFARIERAEEPCIADFNGDGSQNILDFVAFQQAFVGQDCKSDCNEDAVFNILDFVCFQQAFVGGCG